MIYLSMFLRPVYCCVNGCIGQVLNVVSAVSSLSSHGDPRCTHLFLHHVVNGGNELVTGIFLFLARLVA
ncbi:DUF2545 family protein [Shigella flexneri]